MMLAGIDATGMGATAMASLLMALFVDAPHLAAARSLLVVRPGPRPQLVEDVDEKRTPEPDPETWGMKPEDRAGLADFKGKRNA